MYLIPTDILGPRKIENQFAVGEHAISLLSGRFPSTSSGYSLDTKADAFQAQTAIHSIQNYKPTIMMKA